MARKTDTILAIDPGSSKCGVAVLSGSCEILHHAVVAAADLHDTVQQLCEMHSPSVILIGDGTCAEGVSEAIGPAAAPVEFVDEAYTSLAARKRYFADNHPRGWRRLIPISMQTPGRAYDDYVAIILAERYLSSLS